MDSGSWKIHKRRLHFIHSVALHCQLETLHHMVICDKKFYHHQWFAGQEEIKRILLEMRYNMDDIVTKLTWVERYVYSI